MRNDLKSRIGKLLAQVESLAILKPVRKVDWNYVHISVEARRRLIPFLETLDRLKAEGWDPPRNREIMERDCPDFMELMAKVYPPMFPGDSVDKYAARVTTANAIKKLHESSSSLRPAPSPADPKSKKALEHRSVRHEPPGIENDRTHTSFDAIGCATNL